MINKLVSINEYFAYYQIPKIVKEDPHKVKFTQMDQAQEHLYERNTTRLSIIKKAFNDIIEFILSKKSKCYVAVFKSKLIISKII